MIVKVPTRLDQGGCLDLLYKDFHLGLPIFFLYHQLKIWYMCLGELNLFYANDVYTLKLRYLRYIILCA